MQAKKILIDKERWVFQLILTVDNQQELMNFIGKMELPVMTYMSCKILEGKKAKWSIKCTSEEAYKEVYQNLDKLIMEIL